MGPSKHRNVADSDIDSNSEREEVQFRSAKQQPMAGSSGDEFEESDVSDEDNMDEEGGKEEDSSQEEGGLDGQEDEMEQLEKEYMDLRNQEQDILKNLKRNKDEDLQKGEAVKSQKALWNKSLELRFLLQKTFSSSNRLPQEPVRSSFCKSDEAVDKAYADVVTSAKDTLDSILELQEALLEKNPTIAQAAEGNSAQSNKNSKNKNAEVDEEWRQISQMHTQIVPFRNKSVDKWQRKTQVTTGTAAMKNKLQAFNQNISEQVANYMRDPSRMLKQMQQRKLTISVFGVVSDDVENAEGGEGNVDGDPELLDDMEFYQQLLKEFFESIDGASSEAAFYAVKRSQTKKRKIVDRRASKSRKIRYNVHEKIVNFMAPQPVNIPPMAPKLFENLFGLKTQKPASVA